MNILRLVLLFVVFVLLGSFVCAENSSGAIDTSSYNKALEFYAKNTTGLELSEDSFILYQKDSFQIFYSLENLNNVSKDVVTSITCISKRCPLIESIYVDAMPFDTLPPRAKKASGLFVMTNQTPLGKYAYQLNVTDNGTGELQSATFEFEVITDNFWKQFWHNLVSLFF